MLITVGLIQHLCESKAIFHLLRHLRIRSTAGKKLRDQIIFPLYRFRSVWSAWDFSEGIPDLWQGAKKNQALTSASWVLPENNDNIWSNFTLRSSIQTWARLGARKSCYQRPASEMSGVLNYDKIFHWYKKSRYFTDPPNKNRLETRAQGTLLSPLW